MTLTITTPKGKLIYCNRTQAEVNRAITEWSEWLDQCWIVSIHFTVH